MLDGGAEIDLLKSDGSAGVSSFDYRVPIKSGFILSGDAFRETFKIPVHLSLGSGVSFAVFPGYFLEAVEFFAILQYLCSPFVSFHSERRVEYDVIILSLFSLAGFDLTAAVGAESVAGVQFFSAISAKHIFSSVTITFISL